MRVDDAVALEAAGKISAMAVDTVIPHLVMEEMLGVRRLEEPQKYYGLVRNTKTILERDHGIFLHSQRKVGYVILMPGKEVDECVRDLARGMRLAYRGAARTQLIRIDRIEDPEARSRTVSIGQKAANMFMMLRQGAQEFQKALTA